MAAAMRTKMPPNRWSESSDLNDVAVELLDAIARKRGGRQRKMKAAPTDQYQYFHLILSDAQVSRGFLRVQNNGT